MHRFIANPQISFKRTVLISLGLGFSFSAIYWCKHLEENVKKYQHAYHQIPRLIANRKWKHRIEGVHDDNSNNNNSNRASNTPEGKSDFKASGEKLAITKSNESITIIEVTTDEHAIARRIEPSFSSQSESKNESQQQNQHQNIPPLQEDLGKLSKEMWPDFIAGEEKDNEFYVSIGVRRAFGEGTVIHRLGFTHAVVLVEKRNILQKSKSFAVFGYNAGKLTGRNLLFMLNDMNNTSVSRQFTFYNELTIKFASSREVKTFFDRLESASEQPYKVFTCNCFSPIFTAMIETSERATLLSASSLNSNPTIQVPEHFMESLAISVPTEQNFGFGMSSNKEIKPYAELASAAINVATKRQLMLKSKDVNK